MYTKAGLMNKYRKTIEAIKEINLSALSNEDLLLESNKLKEEALAGASRDSLLVRAYALVKEAAKRTLGFQVYDVQLLGAITLNNKNIIEMNTGEGKTLVAVFPAYLNSLYKKGVHILTFNDYLAKRDALWMGPIYELLGISVAFVQESMGKQEKKEAYSKDITYVTAKEAGFDYLRDSLCYDKKDLIHRSFYFAIVDEADSILIDEARIPLVIAVNTKEVNSNLKKVREAISSLIAKVDYKLDEYAENVYLTDQGIDRIEKFLGCGNLYTEENFTLLQQVNCALYAEVLLQKDIDYIVRNKRIEMVDEFTGRVSENRHWPDGVQAALECKEGLEIQSKGRIMTQITLQHFIKQYENLAGMTGTAMDASDEFYEFYDMELVVIPPKVKSHRIDCAPHVFTHKEAKYKALVEEIKKVHSTGQPVLIGTSSVKESDHLAKLLAETGISCQVLNAKNDELEAPIIEKAGVLGAVTVSTNMAGRGVDILLGGPEGHNKEKIKELGGLYVIGTNFHESLRIDKQLKGRAGRQGDPGLTCFFVSLEDELMVKYGLENMLPTGFYPKKQQEALSNPIYAKKISQVQRIVQGHNYDVRKELYNYSTLLNEMRQHLYKLRMEILEGNFEDRILEMDFPKLYTDLKEKYRLAEIEAFKRNLRLFHLDQHWADYLDKAANLRQGIHLNAIGGKDPLREFQLKLIEGFELLKEEVEESIKDDYKKLEHSPTAFEKIKERAKAPEATWTYLVNDDSIEDTLGLLKGLAKLSGMSNFFSWLCFAGEYGFYKLFKGSK